MPVTMQDLPYELMIDLMNHLDKRHKTRCQRLSKRFQDVCQVEVQQHCVPFGWGTNARFSDIIQGLASEHLPGAVVFTASPNKRYIGPADEQLIGDFIEAHAEVTFYNVSVDEDFIINLGGWRWEPRLTLSFGSSDVRIIADIGRKLSYNWEVPLSREIISVDEQSTNLALGMRSMIRKKFREMLQGQEAAHVEWLHDCMVHLEDYDEATTKAVKYFLRRYASEKLPYVVTKLRLSDIKFGRMPLKYVAILTKYLQVTMWDLLPPGGGSFPGDFSKI